MLAASKVARVAADPAKVPEAARPGGWSGLTYHRLHGSPVMYRSAYEEPVLADLTARLQTESVAAEAWCMFDNTQLGAAASDALKLMELIAPPAA